MPSKKKFSPVPEGLTEIQYNETEFLSGYKPRLGYVNSLDNVLIRVLQDEDEPYLGAVLDHLIYSPHLVDTKDYCRNEFCVDLNMIDFTGFDPNSKTWDLEKRVKPQFEDYDFTYLLKWCKHPLIPWNTAILSKAKENFEIEPHISHYAVTMFADLFLGKSDDNKANKVEKYTTSNSLKTKDDYYIPPYTRYTCINTEGVLPKTLNKPKEEVLNYFKLDQNYWFTYGVGYVEYLIDNLINQLGKVAPTNELIDLSDNFNPPNLTINEYSDFINSIGTNFLVRGGWNNIAFTLDSLDNVDDIVKLINETCSYIPDFKLISCKKVQAAYFTDGSNWDLHPDSLYSKYSKTRFAIANKEEIKASGYQKVIIPTTDGRTPINGKAPLHYGTCWAIHFSAFGHYKFSAGNFVLITTYDQYIKDIEEFRPDLVAELKANPFGELIFLASEWCERNSTVSEYQKDNSIKLATPIHRRLTLDRWIMSSFQAKLQEGGETTSLAFVNGYKQASILTNQQTRLAQQEEAQNTLYHPDFATTFTQLIENGIPPQEALNKAKNILLEQQNKVPVLVGANLDENNEDEDEWVDDEDEWVDDEDEWEDE